MKPALLKSVLLFYVLLLLPACVSAQETKTITVRVVDETGAPVVGAQTVINYVRPGRGEDDRHVGLSDRTGRFSAQGVSVIGVYLSASKDGYYPAVFEPFRTAQHVLPKGSNVEQTLVLPRVLKPTALYALDIRPGNSRSVNFPAQNEWLGYDFEMGDWVQPRGKGKTTDILFRFSNEFKGYRSSGDVLARSRELSRQAAATQGEPWTEEAFRLTAGKWDGVLEISFPGAKEGLREETERFLSYSRLKMPHTAPADGYAPTRRYTANTYSGTKVRDDMGFFIRTRVKLDDKGDIVSANYTKIVGDFYLDARGFMMFASYFNPTPNDRNLEFDPKRNLFPANFPGANVNDP